ncbi:glycosyltransferase [Raoultella terrigena]|uniref:glycosyltransferase n=1 Tax=Raoultella terrigena TaxID=577 RepID=UPI001F323DD3|nr:glycosyltransferase [Raoultella terrigena]
MKVLHIAETAKGGVGTIINSLLNINSVESYVLIPDSQSEMILSGKQYLFKRDGRNIASLCRLTLESYRVIKKINPDVIHLHSSFAGMIVRTIYLLKLLRKEKVIIIYTPHAFSFLMNVPSFKKNIFACIERTLARVTDYIVCTSNYEMDTALKYKINRKKTFVIYNGVKVSSLSNTNHSACLSDEHKSKKIKILFLGRFDYQKGYDQLLYIIKKLCKSKYHFDIIGEAVNNNSEKINAPNVEYHGWLPQNELGLHFSNADFLIMPSRWESFGLVAVEAQLYGLPVLANKCSSLPEVIDDNRTGVLLDFSDLESVVDFISKKDKLFWNSKKELCVKFAQDKFSDKKMELEYYSLYKNEGVIKNGKKFNE